MLYTLHKTLSTVINSSWWNKAPKSQWLNTTIISGCARFYAAVLPASPLSDGDSGSRTASILSLLSHEEERATGFWGMFLKASPKMSIHPFQPRPRHVALPNYKGSWEMDRSSWILRRIAPAFIALAYTFMLSRMVPGRQRVEPYQCVVWLVVYSGVVKWPFFLDCFTLTLAASLYFWDSWSCQSLTDFHCVCPFALMVTI